MNELVDEARRLATGTWSTTAARRAPDGVDEWWSTIEQLGWVDADTEAIVTLAIELGRVLAPGRFASAATGAFAMSALGTEGVRATPALEQPVVATRAGRAWRLDGVCDWVPAPVAPALAVAARTPDGGSIVAVVPAADVTVEPVEPIDRTRSFTTVRIEGVVTDTAAPIYEAIRDHASLLYAADAAGVASEALARTVVHAKDRVQFGKPIGSFQAVKHRCADMHLLVHGALAAVRRAAESTDARAVSVAKSYAGDAAARVTADAIQLHGGIGYTWEHDCHLFLKRARLDQALGGDSRWHRRRLAGRYAG